MAQLVFMLVVKSVAMLTHCCVMTHWSSKIPASQNLTWPTASAFNALGVPNPNVTLQWPQHALHKTTPSCFSNHPISFFVLAELTHSLVRENKRFSISSQDSNGECDSPLAYTTQNLHSSLSSPLLSSLLLSLLSFYLSLSIFFTIVQSLKGRLNVLFHLAAILVSMSTRYESPHPPKTWTQSLKHVTINIAINQFM